MLKKPLMISQPRNEIQLFKIIISFNACYSDTGLKKIRVNRLYDFYCKLNAACIVEGENMSLHLVICYFTMMKSRADSRISSSPNCIKWGQALNSSVFLIRPQVIPSTAPPTSNLSRFLISQNWKHLCGRAACSASSINLCICTVQPIIRRAFR